MVLKSILILNLYVSFSFMSLIMKCTAHLLIIKFIYFFKVLKLNDPQITRTSFNRANLYLEVRNSLSVPILIYVIFNMIDIWLSNVLKIRF